MATQIPGIVNWNGNGSVSDQGDYWLVEATSSPLILDVGDGQTVENVLFRPNGNYIQLEAFGTGWTIRNVGYDGIMPNYDRSGSNAIAISGSGTVENVYLGDGGHGDYREKHGGPKNVQPTGIFTFDNGPSGGHITIRNVNAQNWTDNAMYLEGQNNVIDLTVENCYGADNDISFIRPGEGTHEIINCHGIDNHGGGRDLWNRSVAAADHVTVRDCEFESGMTIAGQSDVSGTNTGGSANPMTPAELGVPTTAMEAATGQAGGRSDPPTCFRTTL